MEECTLLGPNKSLQMANITIVNDTARVIMSEATIWSVTYDCN